MERARSRFLLEQESGRRSAARVVLVVSTIGLPISGGVAGVYGFQAYSGDVGPGLAAVARGAGALFAFLVLVFAVALFVRLRPRSYVAVDLGAGRATFVRRGVTSRDVPLADVGPLEHATRQRRVAARGGGSKYAWRLATFHVARSGPFPELVLADSEDELDARRALETHAKAWGVPYRQLSGEERRPEDLDVPLFQKLGSDASAREPLPQAPGSSLSVAWRDEGYEISTSYRPPLDRTTIVGLVVGPIVLAWLLRRPLVGALHADTPAPLRVGFAFLVLLAIVPALSIAAKTARRLLRPPVVRVSADGVRYRGRPLPLASIEEIELGRGGACRLVSDRRIVEIDPDFCEPREWPWLHHELRRLVVEVGQRLPAA